MKIALFGTSADPPTVGHQAILRWLANHYDLVATWASDNPFKKGQTSLEDRMEMLRLAIEEIDPPRQNIQVYPELSDRRSLFTVQKAREIWGDRAEFILVIGADLVTQIVNWYRIEELLQQVRILVVPRTGYQLEPKNLDALIQLGGKVAIATFNAPKVSSTNYRSQKDEDAIAPAVQNYIEQKQLYSACSQSN